MKGSITNCNRLVMITSLMACLLFCSNVQAQSYSRKSLTLMIAEYSNGKPISSYYFSNLQVPQRFDHNNIGTVSLPLGVSFKSYADVESIVDRQVREQRIPNKILRSILIDESKGYMSIEKVQQRGLYNANDREFVIAKNSALGINVLKDAGVTLLRNIYFIVIVPKDYSISYDQNSKANNYSLDASALIYQLDLDSSYMAGQFWEDFYFDSPNSTKMQKLMNYNFKLKRTWGSASSSSSDLDGVNTANATLQMLTNSLKANPNNEKREVDASQLTRKSLSQIHSQLMQRSVKSALSTVSDGDEFEVRGSVFKSLPLQSKIGKREGVKADKLYEVTERVINRKTGKTTVKRVGYVRARFPSNNVGYSAGKTKPSTFYRATTKKRVRKGMELKEVPSYEDSRWTLGFSYNQDSTSTLGGVFANAEYRTYFIPGLQFGIDFGYWPKLKTSEVYYLDKKINGYFRSDALTAVFSLKQSFSWNRLSITPMGGVMYSHLFIKESDIMTKSDMDENYPGLNASIFGLVYGGDIGINLNRTVQLHAGVRYAKATEPLTRTSDSTKIFIHDLKFRNFTYTAGIRLFRL